MEELISKKDLLIETNISYGQLYRWKRKNIIPENWFIKKSTFTGQETFFPRDKILERINLILSMKDEVSLDDIANMFDNTNESMIFDIEKLEIKNIITSTSKSIFFNMCGNIKKLGQKELLLITIIDKYLINSTITIDEMNLIKDILDDKFDNLLKDNSVIFVYRKLGISFVLGCEDSNKIILDKNLVLITKINVVKELNELKRNLI